MAATKRWRSDARFHGVACLGLFCAVLSGCGSEIGTDPANVNDDDHGTLGSNVSNYRIEAIGDPDYPASKTFRVVDDEGNLVDDYSLSWDFGDGSRHLENEEDFTFAGAGQYMVSVTGTGSDGDVAFSLSLEVQITPSPDGPIAVAGDGQSVDENAIVYLFGGNTANPRGLELSYTWSQLDGPDVMILDADTMTATFVAPLVDATTTLTFELVAGDGEYMSSDEVSITVNDLGGEAVSVEAAAVFVTANAGPDQRVYGATTVTLDGSRSSGPSGTPPTFRWRQLSGPTVVLRDATRAVANFVAPLATSADVALTFRLTVVVGSGRSNDSVTVTVMPNDPCLADTDGDGADDCGDDCPNDALKTAAGACGCGVADTDSDADGIPDCLDSTTPPPPTPLVASAGADSSIAAGANALLAGSASGGTAPYSYRWSPTTGLSSSTIAAPTASPSATSTYTLTVTDATGQTANDSMVVTVQASVALVANAGADRSITSGASTTLTGSATGGTPPFAYRWSPTTGLNNPNVASPTAAPTANTTFTVTVTDAAARTASDSVLVTVMQPSPALSAGVQSLSFGNASTSMTFEVWNSGGQTLNYTLSDNASWLTLSPTSGSSTGEHDTITATVSRAGLVDNNYNGVITVTPAAGVVWSIAVSMSVSTTPGGSMTAANRTSGVAPLAVVFDAVRGDSGVAAPLLTGARRDYAACNYAWSFADNAAATWTHSGKSKNEASGFVAAHVFETPGSYLVTLNVTDPTGSVRAYEQTITVTDPEVVFANGSADTAERTLYVSSAGNDANNGSLNRPLQTWARAKTLLFASNGPRRVLLRRGDSFVHSTGGTVTGRTGPFQVGAYGTGANPVISNLSSSYEVLSLDATATDVRMMDVDMVGDLVGSGIRPGTNTLVFRCRLSNFSNAFTTSSLYGSKQGVVIAENEIVGNVGYGVYYNFGQHVAILGNMIDKPTGTTQDHNMRVYITHSLVGHNVFRGGSAQRHQLKFCGFSPTGSVERPAGTPTETVEFSIISDNTFERSDAIAWMITLGPVDNAKDQRTQDVVFERNVLRADASTQVMLYANNSYITVRNNVFDGTLKPGVTAIRVTQRGVEPPPVGYNVFNNTCYSAASSGGLTCAQIDSMASQTTVRNNFAAVATGGLMIASGGSGLVQSNNVLVTSGGFVNAAAGDFRLTAGSVAIDAGMALPQVFEDKVKVRRTVNGDGRNGAEPDAGAFEYVP